MAPAVVARTGAIRVWHCILALMLMVAVASLYFAVIGGYDVAPLHVAAVNVDVDVAAVDTPPVSVIFNDTWLVSYRKRHAELLATPAVPKRMFVYSCKRACGGLGDRMIGITNLLALSVLADRAVMLDQKDSDWWQWVYSPGLHTRYDKALLQGGETELLAYMTDELAERLEHEDINRVFPADVTRLRSNLPLLPHLFRNARYRQRIIDMGWLGDASPADFAAVPAEIKLQCTALDHAMGLLNRAMIEPTRALQLELDTFKANHLRKPSLCVHLRLAKLGNADFRGDDPNPIDPAWMWQCAELYRNITDSWFVASDSITELQAAQAREGDRVVSVQGKPKHIDRHSSVSELEMRKIWMDFFLLAECDVTIASSSNFSRMSVYREFYCPHVCNHVSMHMNQTAAALASSRERRNQFGTPCVPQHRLALPRPRPVPLSATLQRA